MCDIWLNSYLLSTYTLFKLLIKCLNIKQTWSVCLYLYYSSQYAKAKILEIPTTYNYLVEELEIKAINVKVKIRLR